jgi:hypothetical protein
VGLRTVGGSETLPDLACFNYLNCQDMQRSTIVATVRLGVFSGIGREAGKAGNLRERSASSAD